MAKKDQALRVDLTGGLLTITIGVSELCGQLRRLCTLDRDGVNTCTVTDEDAFVRAIAEQLRRADDRGIGPVHHLIDEAAADALAGRCDGVRIGEVS